MKLVHTSSMASRVGIFQAKTHLSALLDRVAKGECITITRHGKPAAMLVPIKETEHKLRHKEVVSAMKALRERVKPGKMAGRDMVNQGPRF